MPEGWQQVAAAPMLLRATDGGSAAVFRYGAVVLFEVGSEDATQLCDQLNVRQRLDKPEREDLRLRVVSESPLRLQDEFIEVPDLGTERLQLIATALARSVILDHYERAIAATFDAIEPLARELHLRKPAGRQARTLLAHIGDSLLAELRMLGRAEVTEKPDLLWDAPGLERFFARLEDEYELRERAAELERKLDLISRTARTALDLLQSRSSLRVEWYIVILIVVEIGLTLYELWWH